MWVIAELRPGEPATWWSLPEGWRVVASDIWGTVLARQTGTMLELALADFTETGGPAPPPTTQGSTPARLTDRLDVVWEPTGLPHSCGRVWWVQQDMSHERCTEIRLDPRGMPVTFDPATRSVTRHMLNEDPVIFTLADTWVDPTLLAATASAAYFSLDNEWPEYSDIVAVSITRADAGEVLARYPNVLPIGDIQLYVVPDGLVTVGWYEPGPHPPDGATPIVRWLEEPGFRPVQFDVTANEIHAHGRRWSLTDRHVRPNEPGMGHVVATDDGGFLALYIEHSGQLRAELMRGYADGTVEYWLFPGSWIELGMPTLEPRGSFLVPDDGSFVRVSPFAPFPE